MTGAGGGRSDVAKPHRPGPLRTSSSSPEDPQGSPSFLLPPHLLPSLWLHTIQLLCPAHYASLPWLSWLPEMTVEPERGPRACRAAAGQVLSLIHISEPTRPY